MSYTKYNTFTVIHFDIPTLLFIINSVNKQMKDIYMGKKNEQTIQETSC